MQVIQFFTFLQIVMRVKNLVQGFNPTDSIDPLHWNQALFESNKRRFPPTTVIKDLPSKLHGTCDNKQKITKDCHPTAKYRTIDGTCNNMKNPLWGSSFMPFRRVLQPDYYDGFDAPRGGFNNSKLPNTRLISIAIHGDSVIVDPTFTNMVPQVGQFLDHDISRTNGSSSKNCCKEANDIFDCWPIQIPPNDTFYSNLSIPQTCLKFRRSNPLYCFSQTNGIREQFNSITGFVDASQVYGSDTKREHLLREGKGGRLWENSKYPNMLPSIDDIKTWTGENLTDDQNGDFVAGDGRVNETPGLTVMQTLLFREHNRLASAIQSPKPHWTDERIYQEARRLLIAQWQNVIYGEFLPIILGQDAMDGYKMTLTNEHSHYDPTQDATIDNEFATAAYRFGHALTSGLVRLIMIGLGEFMGSYELRDNFFDYSQIIRNNSEGYNWILGGLMTQNSRTFDPHVTEDLTNHLFQDKGKDFGGDLMALNLQRGRDHGLPAYNAYRQECGFKPLDKSWGRAPEDIRPSAWEILSELYEKPEDIDLFTGGLVEYPVPGTLSGPTFICLKARQFARLKFGDRYFFTHDGGFSRKQIEALRGVTLGNIICQNSNLTWTTRNVFRVASMENPWLHCEDPERGYLDVDMFL